VGVEGPYDRLSRWLSEMVRTGDTPVDVGRRVGRRRRLGATDSSGPVAELVHEMASHGFEPLVRQRGSKADDCRLRCHVETEPQT
jgi:hypothetical protein